MCVSVRVCVIACPVYTYSEENSLILAILMAHLIVYVNHDIVLLVVVILLASQTCVSKH